MVDRERPAQCLAQVQAYRASGLNARVRAQATGPLARVLGQSLTEQTQHAVVADNKAAGIETLPA